MDSRLAIVIVVFCCAACFICGMIFEATVGHRLLATATTEEAASKIVWKDGPDGRREAYIDGKMRLYFDRHGDLYTDCDKTQPEEAGN